LQLSLNSVPGMTNDPLLNTPYIFLTLLRAHVIPLPELLFCHLLYSCHPTDQNTYLLCAGMAFSIFGLALHMVASFLLA
jgi:hypothetical protein